MTLVKRYLDAVRDHLPRDQQDDIINELSDNIQSRLEDEESVRGRPLAEDEQVAILRAIGHPLAVAARYRGDDRSVNFGRQLIGPELFPAYLKVLGINFAVTSIVLAIIALASGSLWTGLGGIVVPFAIQFVAVTLIFVAVDRHWIRNPDGWDPRTVNSMGPDVDISTVDGIAVQLIGKENSRAVAVTTSVVEIGLIGVILAAWLAIGVPDRIGFLAPEAGWRDLFVPVAVLIVATLSIPVVTLFRPTWTSFRVAGHAAVDIATIVLGLISLSIGSWVSVADPVSAPADAGTIVEVINGIVRVSIAATVVLTAVNAALEVRRFVRMRRAA